MPDETVSEAEWRLAETIVRLVPRCREAGEEIEESGEINPAKVAWYGVALPVALVAIGLLPCLLDIGRRPPESFGGGVVALYLAVGFSRYWGGRTASLTAMTLSLLASVGSFTMLDWSGLIWLMSHAAALSTVALLPFNRDDPGQRLGLLRRSRNRRSKEFARESISSSFETGLPCFSRRSNHS